MVELNKEKLSKETLERLSKIQELPNEGFLCGGAVANTILSIIDGKEYPINDLDVFSIDKDNPTSKTPIRMNGIDLNMDRYENRILIPSNAKCTYRIISTHYDKSINYVYVYFSHHTEMKLKEQYDLILDSFDINCCKAGIDLSNGNLFLNNDFLEFIRTRQLECVNPTTPAHTAIRIIKKRDDLSAFLNKDEVFKFLSQFYLYDNNVVNVKINLTLFFGKKYKELFHKYETELNEYFELWTYAKTRKHYFQLQSSYFINKTQLNESNNKVNIPNWVYSLEQTIDPMVMNKWYETKLWALMPKKFNLLDQEISKYYKPEFGTNPTIIKKLWYLIYKQNKKQKNKSTRLLNIKEFYPFVIVNDDFHNCDFSDINIKKLGDFINENPSFSRLIHLTKLNFQESEKLMNMIKKLFPQELDLFCELIFKEIYEEKYFKNDFDNKKILDQDYVTNKYNMVKNIMSKELIPKLDLDDFEYGYCMKELNSPMDLLWGGKFMHNCLKGYNENGFNLRIERDEIRVFIISDEKERTALQISKTYSNTYKIDQIYGHSNSVVCVKHKMIADYLISFLEYKHYLLESQRIIDNFKSNRIGFIENIDTSSYEKYEYNNHTGGFDPLDHLRPIPIEPTIIDEPEFLGVTIGNEMNYMDDVGYLNDDFDDAFECI